MTMGEFVVLDVYFVSHRFDLQYYEPIMVLIGAKRSKKGHCSILTSRLRADGMLLMYSGYTSMIVLAC